MTYDPQTQQTDEAVETESATDTKPPPRVRFGYIQHAGVVFGLMFAINVVNYLDRFVAAAVGPQLKLEFHLDDAQVGWLTTAFLLVYTVAALPLGLLADRFSRARIVALGVGVWSVFSGATAFVRNFGFLFATRVGVGVGEASYLPAGTALLSSYFPLRRRARIMSLWSAGQIVGVALAFAITYLLFALYPPRSAWRVAFFVTAVPGVALAALMWFVRDAPAVPVDEAEEGVEEAPAHGHTTLSLAGGPRAALDQITQVLAIRTVRVVVVLQALYFIVTTPAVVFLSIYVQSATGPFHLDAKQGSIVSGVMIIVGGLSGALTGGLLADWLGKRFAGARVLTATVGGAIGLPCYLIALTSHSLASLIVFGIIAIFAFNLQLGPIMAAVQDVTPPALRGSAVAVTLLLSHLLGDIWSPTMVGYISASLGDHVAPALLTIGLPALILGIVVAFFGARIYARELATRTHSAR